MIREKSLKCKLLLLRESEETIFNGYMASFRPEKETCPICGARGACVIHAYYGRTLISCNNNELRMDRFTITRVICSSCGHTHAILPDIIIPYERHSLLFILSVLAERFTKNRPVYEICRDFGISEKQFYRWLRLWRKHSKEWLGLLEALETDDQDFLKRLITMPVFSDFTSKFTQRFSSSFLQSHKNPANYCQHVFT